jgi:hypothetical protein
VGVTLSEFWRRVSLRVSLVFILNAIFFIPDFNSQSVNASVACTQVNRNLDNGKIRFSTGGGGQDNSILLFFMTHPPPLLRGKN